MIVTFGRQAFITVNTSFRKDYDPYQLTLSATIAKPSSLEGRQRVVDRDLYLAFAETMSHALRIVPP